MVTHQPSQQSQEQPLGRRTHAVVVIVDYHYATPPGPVTYPVSRDGSDEDGMTMRNVLELDV